MQEQAELIANSAALFTNHGGGSASTVFLPKGVSAFVYWRGQQRDIEFYRMAYLYFRTEWIDYNQRRDVMEEEHADMMETLNKIKKTDFDNTKRIERPEEILERRRREREARNVWYRQWGRWLTGQKP
jgi:hypothetical protein